MEHFDISEFDSPDAPGSGKNMQESTLNKLDKARGKAGIAFIVNSGFRTSEHNKKVGGVDSSAHTRGHAADIKVKSGRERYIVVMAAISAGFTRIGIARTFIHLDDDPDLPQSVIWKY